MNLSKRISAIKSYFNVANDLESQAEIEASIRSGVSFRGAQLLVLIFAIFVASLGLNTDSTPVVIGAMLISPLMGPIIGMGMGIGVHDFTLLRRGLKNIALAVIGSLLASALYFLISPQYEGNSQLLARTSPSIYDAFIALFGGAAGILSIAAKNKGQVLPGVAIATSLMPPLCTAGYGLATLQWSYFIGALYLFFTNMVFILFATWIGVKLMGLKPVPTQDTRRARRVQALVYVVVVATIGVSAYLTALMLRRSIFIDKATDFVETQLKFPNAEVLSHKEYINGATRHIDITLIGEHMPQDSLELAVLKKMDAFGLGGTQLTVRQGFMPDIKSGTSQNEDVSRMYSLMQSQLNARIQESDSLSSLLEASRRMEDAASMLAPEIRVVFPRVRGLAVSRTVATRLQADKMPADTVNLLLVDAPTGLPAGEKVRLAEYAAVRLGLPHISVVVNPTSFPWPESLQQSE